MCITCKKFGVDCSNGGEVFSKTPNEIEQIVAICEQYGIPYKDAGGVFYNKLEILRQLIQVCNAEYLEVKGAIFFTNPERLTQSVDYVRSNYGEKFVNRMIVFQSLERLKEVLPHLEEKGCLEGPLGKSASILSLSLGEIKIREMVVEHF